ncbi:hypothetical protein, partial [Herbaspirillum frisingense]|uniref:hypothetical protein n=1 Tax=Herbaspirillum frisingense TaxID=92645 RepID=UPI0039B0F6EE
MEAENHFALHKSCLCLSSCGQIIPSNPVAGCLGCWRPGTCSSLLLAALVETLGGGALAVGFAGAKGFN